MIKRNPFSRLLGMVLCICMVLSMLPGIPLVANAAETTTMKIYFRNDWNWSDIKIYFWGSKTATNPGWPGYSMSYYGSSNNQAYYVYEVPTDVTGIIVSGNNGSKRDQSPDITSGWYDGITYYMFWDNRNTVKSFNIRDVFACKHPNTQTVAGYAATCTEDGLSDGQKCTECGEMAVAQTVIPAKGHSFADGICSVCGAERYMDIYFRNDWNWTDIKLYFWGSQTDTNPEWSGNPMTFFDNDGSFDYFVMSVPTDVIGIVINGIKDDGSGALDQSPDIESGWYDGITYYMHWDGGNAVSSFNISDVKFPCKHSWNDATCTTPKTCSVCGETEGNVDLDNHTSTDYTYKYYRNRYFNSHEKFHACCGVSVGMENHSYNEQTGLCNECDAGILISVEMINAPTEYLTDVEYALRRGGRSATLLKDHTNTKSYSVAVDALYFAEGVTLTNNGTLVMPENFDLSTLVNNYNGTGVVTVGDASYVWNGEKFICAGEHTPGSDGICVLCGERATYDIWVQDIQVTVGNAADVLGNLDEGATVTYDAATNTLYLNNATIGGAEVGIKAGGDLNLHITGNNSITTVESESATHGIYTNIGVLTIDGTGSLHIQCAAAVSASYGIVADNGLHIKGGSVTAIAGNASISIGVKTAISRIVTVDSGAALTASGDPDGRFFGNGIVTKTVTGEGTVNAIATLTPNADENDHTEYLVIYGNVTLAEDAPSMGFYQVMEGAVLTVAEGIVLDMSNITADKITLDGTIVNNGTVVLPDSYTYTTIPTAITGGIVTIGESSYIWNGSKYICVNHSWVDATCTTLKTCSVCGATEGEKADHRFENGMCVYGCGTVQTFTVTYAGYGTEHLRSETVDFNTTIQLPQAFFGCNPIGYVFVEFNTQPDGSGESYREFDWYRVTGDVTLYARWAELAIGGGFLNSGEYMDLQGNVTVTQPDGGYAYFDNGTLTLHDFSYTGAGNRIYYRTQILMTNIYYHMGHLNLVLEGENSLTNTAVEGFSVLSENELTVSGSGSLTAKADFITVYSQTSIHVESGTMDLTGGYLAVGAINGITIENAQLLIPENGSVQADANQHYIADSEGNMATSVVIAGVHTHSDADNSGRCDICNELMQPAKICFATASLEGNIAINFYTLLSDKVAADPDAYMQFIMADDSVIEVYVRDAVSGELNDETYYVFTCSVNAKEMADDVLCRFCYEGGSTAEVIYNVKTYGNYIINEHDDASAKALAEAMLNYGAASQLHFGHNTDNLANAELQTPDYSDVVIEGYDAEAGQGTDLAKLYSASLILKSETTLRFFFQVDSSVESFTVTMNGQALEVKVRGGLYYVDVVGIAAKDLNKAVTITINDGTTTADVSFNPMSYCQGVQNDTTGAFSDEMKDLVAALYLYNQAANEYFMEG